MLYDYAMKTLGRILYTSFSGFLSAVMRRSCYTDILEPCGPTGYRARPEARTCSGLLLWKEGVLD